MKRNSTHPSTKSARAKKTSAPPVFTAESVALSAMLSDLPKYNLEPDSWTINELAKKRGLNPATVRRHANELVTSGKWRKTFKHVGNRPQPSYAPNH